MRHSRKEETVSDSDKTPAEVDLDLVAFAEALAVLALALVAQFSQRRKVILQGALHYCPDGCPTA